MLHNLNQDVLHIFFNLRDHYTSAFFVESVNSKVFEYAHAFTHLIFSLSIIACFIFNNLPFRQASIACVALARSHKPKFLVIPLVYKKLKFIGFKVFQIFIYAWCETSQTGHFVNILWNCCCLKNFILE